MANDPIISAPEASAAGDQAPRTPFWDLAPQDVYVQFDERLIMPWERVTLAGMELPGICTVISPGRVRKVQRNAGPGDEAEELIDLGALAADVQIVVQIWTPAHLAAWEAFSERMSELLAEARGATGKKSAPSLDVVHPGLTLAGITSLYVYQVSVLQPSSTPGAMESTILASEYREKKKSKDKRLAPIQASKADLRMSPEIERAVSAPATPSATEAGP